MTVFASASSQAPDRFARAAAAFGRDLAEAGVGVVYGGGDVGLMGAMADGALSAGGALATFNPPRHKYDNRRMGMPAARGQCADGVAS
jgi:predicted Rossmann-fold nucleotide-binding protein